MSAAPNIPAILAALRPVVRRTRKEDPEATVRSMLRAAQPGGAEATAPERFRREPRAQLDGSLVTDAVEVSGRGVVTMAPKLSLIGKVDEVLKRAQEASPGASLDVIFRGRIAASTDPERVRPEPENPRGAPKAKPGAASKREAAPAKSAKPKPGKVG